MADAFIARAIYTWKPDRLYRIYLSSGQLYFIRIGGQGYALAQAIETQLGPLGEILSQQLRRRADTKMQRTIEETDRIPPEVRVREHGHNLQIHPGQIVESAILAPGRFASHGLRVGLFQLTMRDGPAMKLQFEQLDEMQRALELLPQVLGERLSIEVQWDPSINGFAKRPAAP